MCEAYSSDSDLIIPCPWSMHHPLSPTFVCSIATVLCFVKHSVFVGALGEMSKALEKTKTKSKMRESLCITCLFVFVLSKTLVARSKLGL